MNTLPSKDELSRTLDTAWDVHREFQKVYLKGVRDEAWPSWYAAFVIGRLGDFTVASLLTKLLEAAPNADNWAEATAEYILNELRATNV